MIPSINPKAQYLARKREIDEAMRRVLESGQYSPGENVAAFESEFSQWLGVPHGVGVASGTEALRLVLTAHLVGRNDEVIVAAHGPISVPAAVELAGAQPVFVDTEADFFTLDPEAVRAAITARTRAVIVTHLYGNPADIERLSAIGRKVGTFGHAATFSLSSTMNLGALGDAGIIVTDDSHIARRCRQLREFGWNERLISEVPGGNARLDELHAAVLRVKLTHLDQANAMRREIAALYLDHLSDLPVRLPRARAGAEPVFHRYVVRVSDRETIRGALAQAGIEPAVPHPVPLHRHPAFLDRLGEMTLPVAERAAGESLALPLWPEISAAERDAVIAAFRSCFGAQRRQAS